MAEENDKNPFLFFYKFLIKYYEIKAKDLLSKKEPNNSSLSEGETFFLQHAEMIMKSLDYIESQNVIIDSKDYFITLLRAGRSPLRDGYKTVISSRIVGIHDEGHVHESCCLCTSKVISQLSLIKNLLDDKDISKYIKCKDWLSRKENKENNWLTGQKDKIHRSGYVDAAQSLLAFMDVDNEENAESCAEF